MADRTQTFKAVNEPNNQVQNRNDNYNDYDKEKRINSYALTLFVQEEDNRYERFDEYHEQRAFSIDEVRCAIEESGMIFLAAIDKNGAPATKDTDRVYIIAREKGKTPLQNL